MGKTEKIENNFLGNQPMELAHALFRVAGAIRHEGLRARIQSWSITFLESALLCHAESTAKDIHILEHLIILGEAVGEIPYQNSKILYSQFEKAKYALGQYEKRTMADFDIGQIFPETADVDSVENSHSVFSMEDIGKDRQDVSSAVNGAIPLVIDVTENQVLKRFIPSAQRRSLIVQKIGQLGNAAMKDLLAAFPSVSERTIRYDLQKLCELSVLERSGNGGPASYYKCIRGLTPSEIAHA